MDDSNCNGEWNDGCECLSGQTTTCASQHDSKGICGSRMLTCSTSGAWPAKSTCDSVASTEICTGNLDEDCDGQVNEADACPCAAAPCQNGGTCSASGEAYSCNCSGTGYTGTNCELPVAVTGELPEGQTSCQVAAIAPDGNTVAADCGNAPYYWTAAGGWKSLRLPGGYTSGRLVGMSANGQAFAGTALNSAAAKAAVRWTNPGLTAVVLSSGSGREATAASADTLKVVGSDGTSILLWNGSSSPTTYQPNGQLPSALPEAISGDGNVIYGGRSQAGFVKWTGSSSSSAVTFANTALTVTATNHTGSLVVGYGSNSEVFWYRPWRYQNGSLTWLDTGNTSDCYGESVSDDGTRIAGACRGAATVWIGGIMTDLETYLEDNDVSFGSMSGTANVITPDGKLTAGATSGRVWVIRLP